MINLKQLIDEQNELNIYIEEKTEALRKHQIYLNKIIYEELIKTGLEHTRIEKNPNKHIFTYSELKIEIETKNPVDEKVNLSQAVSNRLKIEIYISRKLSSTSRKYSIIDRTKYRTEYKQNGNYLYSLESKEEPEENFFKVLERIFEHEAKQPIENEDKDLPF